MSDPERIYTVGSVPDDAIFLFRVRVTGGADAGELEAILVCINDGIQGWLSYYMCLAHTGLDKSFGTSMHNDEVICQNHDAYFETDASYYNYGPCEGAALNDLDIAVDGGHVFLLDDEFDYAGQGEVETDPADRSSSSNVEF